MLTVLLTFEHLGQRYDWVIAKLLPMYSRSRIQKWCELGYVLQNGNAVIANHKIKTILPITVYPQIEDYSKAFIPENLPISIVYEDEHLLVLNKEAGRVVHPGAGNWTGTLMNALLHHYPNNAALPRAGIVHRLDCDTTGLMVVAKNNPTYHLLVNDLKERNVHRRYLALIYGVPVWKTYQVNVPLGRDPKLRTRMAVLLGTPARPTVGKQATTDMRLLASNAMAGVSLIECKLHTGRTHQIRVHLSYIRHALIGDSTYGGKPLLNMYRQALHAWSLQFKHPITRQMIATECIPPPDMLNAGIAIGVDWTSLHTALLQNPTFEVPVSNQAYTPLNQSEYINAEFNQDVYAFNEKGYDEDDLDEDDDFDESGVEVIYVRE